MKRAYGQPKRFTKKTLELLTHIDEIVNSYMERGMSITVRQVYYQCVTQNFIKNSQEEYKKIVDRIRDGRLSGLLDWDAIEDRTRYQRGNVHWSSPRAIIRAAAEQYKINTRATQPYYIECWIEKDSLVSILEDCCIELDVPCFSCRGFVSATALHDAAERFKNSDKRNIILYAGDHDPSGLLIPEKVSEYLGMFGADVELKRIGITREQISELNLPPFPAKEQDGNYKRYVERTGLKSAWELDALPPEKLINIFSENINALTDFSELAKMKELERQDKTYFKKILASA